MKVALHDRLVPFVRRVRCLRVWQSAARGLIVGSILACGAVSWFRLHGHISPWQLPLSLLVVPMVAWAIWAYTRPVPAPMLARSLDRRGHLADRVSTALAMPEGAFAETLQDDAEARMGAVSPAKAFPIGFGRLQGLAVLLALISGGVTLLGNRPITLSPAELARRADAEDAAANIERVLSPYQTPEAKKGNPPELSKEVNDLEKLAMDLKNDQTNRDEALRKSNEIEGEANKLQQQEVKQVRDQLSQMETANDKAQNGDQSAFDPAASAPPEKSNAAADVLQKQIDDLKKQLGQAKGDQAADLKKQIDAKSAARDALRKQAADAQALRDAFAKEASQHPNSEKALEDALKMESMPNAGGQQDPLAEFKQLQMQLMATTQAEIAGIKEKLKTATGAEAERLRKKLAELEKQLDDVRKQIDETNKQILAAIKAMKNKPGGTPPGGPSQPMQHTKMDKPMRDALNHLQDALHQIESGDDLTPEQIAQLKSISTRMQTTAATAKASGDNQKAMTAMVLAQAADALATGNTAVMVAKNCNSGIAGMEAALRMKNRSAGPGGYVPTKDEFNTGEVNHLDKPAEGKGKTTPAFDQSDMSGDGPQSYIELKGPASLNGRSAVPYKSVLPSYQRKAESALNGGTIPKKHQKRVRAYFDSLNGR